MKGWPWLRHERGHLDDFEVPFSFAKPYSSVSRKRRVNSWPSTQQSRGDWFHGGRAWQLSRALTICLSWLIYGGLGLLSPPQKIWKLDPFGMHWGHEALADSLFPSIPPRLRYLIDRRHSPPSHSPSHRNENIRRARGKRHPKGRRICRTMFPTAKVTLRMHTLAQPRTSLHSKQAHASLLRFTFSASAVDANPSDGLFHTFYMKRFHGSTLIFIHSWILFFSLSCERQFTLSLWRQTSASLCHRAGDFTMFSLKSLSSHIMQEERIQDGQTRKKKPF